MLGLVLFFYIVRKSCSSLRRINKYLYVTANTIYRAAERKWCQPARAVGLALAADSREKSKKAMPPRPGIEPGSLTWQARILTTILSRTLKSSLRQQFKSIARIAHFARWNVRRPDGSLVEIEQVQKYRKLVFGNNKQWTPLVYDDRNAIFKGMTARPMSCCDRHPSMYVHRARLAQSVEHQAFNLRVTGSSPVAG